MRSHCYRIAVAGAVLLLGGCADFSARVMEPFWGPKTDKIIGITPPAERVAILQNLSQRAAALPPAEQQRIAAELAAAYAEEDDPLIRTEIVRTLSHYPTTTTAAVLQQALADADVDVRITACAAWGQQTGPEAARQLSGVMASDVDKEVRLAAARALGETGDPAAVAALAQALEDRDPAMQFRAVQSLERCTGQKLGNDVTQWQQYARSIGAQPATPPADSPSVAGRPSEPPR